MNKTSKILIGSSIAVVFVCCLLLGLLPTLLSTHWGQGFVVEKINRTIPGTVSSSGFSLSWFGKQQIQGLTLKSPNGETVLSLDQLETDTPLFQLLSDFLPKGGTTVKALNLKIAQTGAGKTTLEESLGSGFPEINLNGNPSISFENVNAQFELKPSELLLIANGTTKQGNAAGSFNVSMTIENDQMRCSADISHFPVTILDTLIAAQDPQLQGSVRALIGSSLNLSLSQKKDGAVIDYQVNFSSDNLNGAFKGIVDNGTLVIQSASPTVLQLNPALVATLSSRFGWNATLREGTAVNLEIGQSSLPLDFFTKGAAYQNLDAIRLNARISVPGLTSGTQTLKDFSAAISTPESSQTHELLIGGVLLQNGKPLKLKVDASISKARSLDMLMTNLLQPAKLELTLDNASSKAVEGYLGLDGNLQNSLGQTFSLKISSSAKDPQTMQLSLDADHVAIPALLLHLDQTLDFSSAFDRKAYSGNIRAETIAFRGGKTQTFLHDLNLPWKLYRNNSTLEATFSAKTAANLPGSINGSLEIGNISDPGSGTIEADIVGKKVPAEFLRMLTGRKEVAPVFGPTLDLKIICDLNRFQGAVKADLSGERGSLTLRSSIKNGVLTLSEPLRLQTTPSRELGQEVLSQFAPVLSEMVAGEGRIALTIDSNGFSMPLADFQLAHMQIPSAVFEMGKLQFKNAGDLKKLVDSLRPVHSELISVWATPLYIKVENGILHVYRMDMLLMDRYPIATWGVIDFPKDRVNMIVGITAQALAQALDLHGLNESVMLQVPVQGSINNAQIDNTKITTRLASLVAQHKGGPEGLVIGTVLDIANGKQGKVPPPTTNPLPWEGMITNDTSRPSRKEDKTNCLEKIPVDGIKNGAKKLIKDIFR